MSRPDVRTPPSSAVDLAIDRAVQDLTRATGHIRLDAADRVSAAAVALTEAAIALANEVREQAAVPRESTEGQALRQSRAAIASVALAAAALTELVVDSAPRTRMFGLPRWASKAMRERLAR